LSRGDVTQRARATAAAAAVRAMSVGDLKRLLSSRQVSYVGATEKYELVDLALLGGWTGGGADGGGERGGGAGGEGGGWNEAEASRDSGHRPAAATATVSFGGGGDDDDDDEVMFVHDDDDDVSAADVAAGEGDRVGGVASAVRGAGAQRGDDATPVAWAPPAAAAAAATPGAPKSFSSQISKSRDTVHAPAAPTVSAVPVVRAAPATAPAPAAAAAAAAAPAFTARDGNKQWRLSALSDVNLAPPRLPPLPPGVPFADVYDVVLVVGEGFRDIWFKILGLGLGFRM